MAMPAHVVHLIVPADVSTLNGFSHYLRNGPKDYTDDTIRTYLGQVATYLRLQAAGRPVRLADVVSRAGVTSTLMHIPKERASARRNLLFAIKALARYLRDVDVIDDATCTAIAAIKVQSRHEPKRPHLSEEQVAIVLRSLLADRDLEEHERLLNLALFSTLVFTGLRSSEACNLLLADVSFEMGTITVTRGKGRKRRVVGLPDRLVPLLRLYLRHRPEGRAATFFVGSAGNRLDRDLVAKRFRRISDKVGFEVGAHRLRRSFATRVAHAGVPLDKLQMALGHADIKTTRAYVQTDAVGVATEMRGW